MINILIWIIGAAAVAFGLLYLKLKALSKELQYNKKQAEYYKGVFLSKEREAAQLRIFIDRMGAINDQKEKQLDSLNTGDGFNSSLSILQKHARKRE